MDFSAVTPSFWTVLPQKPQKQRDFWRDTVQTIGTVEGGVEPCIGCPKVDTSCLPSLVCLWWLIVYSNLIFYFFISFIVYTDTLVIGKWVVYK